jgi:hypothetical protein
MDAKAEKIAMFRHGLIAPLVFRPFREESSLDGRRKSPRAAMTFLIPNATPSPSIPCSIGRCAIAAVVLPVLIENVRRLDIPMNNPFRVRSVQRIGNFYP